MARPIEKLLKIQQPKRITKMTLETPQTVPTTVLKLDLPNLEPYTEAEMNIKIDLGLDQLETEE
jgi:hypothetical protein